MSCHRKNDYDGPRRTRWWRSSERGRSTRKAELTPWSRYVSNCILTAEQISFATPIFTREPAEHMIFRQIKYRCVSVDGMEKIFPRNSTAKWWNRVSLCTKGQVFFSKCARVFCSRLRSYFGSRATQRGSNISRYQFWPDDRDVLSACSTTFPNYSITSLATARPS